MRFLLLCALLVSAATAAFCGPPFLTDDPEPVPLRHYEFYLFSTLDRGPDGYAAAVPAFDFNSGGRRGFRS